MSQQRFLFWPTDVALPRGDTTATAPAYVVGYRVSDTRIVVVDIVAEFDDTGVRKGLKPLEVVGGFNCPCDRVFQFDSTNNIPVVNEDETLVLFKPPRSGNLEFFSLYPMEIDTFWTSQQKSVKPSELKVLEYSDKLKYHFSAVTGPEQMKDLLHYINLTDYSRSKLHGQRSSWRFENSVNSVYQFLALLYSGVQILCLYLTKCLSYPLIVKKNVVKADDGEYVEGGVVLSLALLSHTFHQINSRAKQLYNVPKQFERLRNSKKESQVMILEGTKFSPSEYIKFYNTVWLIVNDVLLGQIISTSVTTNHEVIASSLVSLIDNVQEWMRSTVIWLMNSPAGFKLNNELAAFFGELILWVLKFWQQYMVHPITSHASTIILVIATLMKVAGCSLSIAVVTDIFQLLTLEYYGFYVACTRVYRWQWHTLQSLFRLFYGKKYNVLRDRVDSNEYEFDELMSGIILFTILIYLFPTVVAFYLTYACYHVLFMFTVNISEFLLICLNHLPIGVILIRIKNRDRLPGGIVLGQRQDSLQLFIKPLSIKQITKGQLNSMLNFNLANYNECYLPIYKSPHYEIADILENWSRISPVNIGKKLLLGDIVDNVEYKKMF